MLFNPTTSSLPSVIAQKAGFALNTIVISSLSEYNRLNRLQVLDTGEWQTCDYTECESALRQRCEGKEGHPKAYDDSSAVR